MKFSEISFVGFKRFISDDFHYLSEFPTAIYVRNNAELTDSEYESYKAALSRPNGENVVHVQITEAVTLYRFNGIDYLIQGNSRKTAGKRMQSEHPDYVYHDVPIRYVIGELTNSEIIRLQFDGNDTTRSHKPIEIFRSIRNQYDELVKSEKVTEVRETIRLALGVTNQTISDALLLTEDAIDPMLIEAIEDGSISSDTAVRIQRSYNQLRNSEGHSYLTMKEVFSGLQDTMHRKHRNKITPSIVKEWRDEFERLHPVLSSEQELIKSMLLDRTVKDGVIRVDSKKGRSEDTKQAVEIDVVAESNRVQTAIATTKFDPNNLNLVSGMIARVASEASESSQRAIYEAMLNLLHSHVNEANPETVQAVANNMARLQ